MHQKRAAASLEKLSVRGPRPDVARRDPYALRVGAVLAAIAALFVAGHEWQPRLMAAFEWRAPPPPVVPPRLDVWINPPAYTDRPPIFLARSDRAAPTPAGDAAAAAPQLEPKANAPIGSILTVRVSPGLDVSAVIEGKLVEKPKEEKATPAPAAVSTDAAAKPAGPFEMAYTVNGDGVLVVMQAGAELGRFAITVVPDQPPKVTLVERASRRRAKASPSAIASRMITALRRRWAASCQDPVPMARRRACSCRHPISRSMPAMPAAPPPILKRS